MDMQKPPKKPYHDRQFLNPQGVFASSQITAFHGNHPYMADNGTLTDCTLTKLVISDCHNSIHLHRNAGDDAIAFVDKLRLIADVCTRFADYLEGGDGE